MQKTTPGSRQQNPLVFYLRTLLYTFMALLVRIITFAPLAVFFVPSEAAFWPWLALLCPLLFFFVLLPLRFSFAQALVQSGPPRRFGFDTAFGLGQYGEKLWQALVHFLSVLKWFIPLALGGLYAYTQMDQDLTGILDGLGQLGLWAGNMVAGVVTFVRGLFGNITPLEIHGGWAEGLLALGAALAVALLVGAAGVMRNSGTRYVWAYASRHQRNLPSENRRRVKNRRWTQLAFALLNLVLWAPFLAGLAAFLPDLLSELPNKLMLLMAGQEPDMSFFTQKTWQLLFAFIVLYLPFVPLRRMITAFFATKALGYGQPSASKDGMKAGPKPVPKDTVASGFALPEEDGEEGLPPLSYSAPLPEPVPAWPEPQNPAQPATPRQRQTQEEPQALHWEAPAQEEPQKVQEADVPNQRPEAAAPPADMPGQPLETAAQRPPQAPAVEPPRQDVEPSAFTIGQ